MRLIRGGGGRLWRRSHWRLGLCYLNPRAPHLRLHDTVANRTSPEPGIASGNGGRCWDV